MNALVVLNVKDHAFTIQTNAEMIAIYCKQLQAGENREYNERAIADSLRSIIVHAECATQDIAETVEEARP